MAVPSPEDKLHDAATDALTSDLDKLNLVEDVAAAVQDDVKAKKEAVRQRVWAYMAQGHRVYPFEHHNPASERRIPYFVGCEAAAEHVAWHRLFKSAKVVKVNPSLAQMHLRYLVLRSGKTLVVPIPSLSQKDFAVTIDGSRLSAGKCSKAQSKKGAIKFGTPRCLDYPPGFHVDVFVVASVAVSASGVRLGKGFGYAELEWAAFWTLGLVDDRTLVVTTVHDGQIVSKSELPTNLMEAHDLPVDFIFTKSKMIKVKKKLPKPNRGIIWEAVTDAMMEEMPMLKKLRAFQKN